VQLGLANGTIVAGRYRIDDFIAEGGLSVVHAATELARGRRVALKVLHPDQSAVDLSHIRMREEAELLARIDHPNVVRIYEIGKLPDGRPFIAMEHILGKTLADVIDEDGPLTFRRILDLATQLVAAVREVHRIGFLHRDLKPQNILIVRDKTRNTDLLKLIDFGIAKPIARSTAPAPRASTSPGMVIGSPHYMAPEQVLAEAVDERTDIYAIGVVLYEMLTGCVPFRDQPAIEAMKKQVIEEIPPIAGAGYGRACPPELEQLVMACLAKDATARIASSEKLTAALGAIALRGSVLSVPEPGAKKMTLPPLRRETPIEVPIPEIRKLIFCGDTGSFARAG
jgi:eukaryotic-like serine/threonine-protein kinase